MSSNASVSVSTPAHRRDNSWLSVAFIAIVLGVVALAIVALWLQVSPRAPLPVDKFFPLPNGAAFVYRVTKPDGTVTYRARNVQRLPANQLGQALPLSLLGAFFRAANADVLQSDPVAALRALSAIDSVILRDVEYDAQGKPLTQTKTLAILGAERIDVFAVNDVAIEPPLPALDLRAPTQNFTGTLNTEIPYTFSLTQMPRAQINTALGELRDCIQTHTTLAFLEIQSASDTTFCAGIGQALDETTTQGTPGAERAEIVAASIGDFIKGSAPFPGVGGPSFESNRTFPDNPTLTLTETLRYQEHITSNGITTEIIPAGDVLLYGTASGALVAFNPTTQAEQWRFQAGDAVFSTPSVANGLVYFGSADKKVYALRLADGAFVWAFRTNDIVSAPPAAKDGVVYAASEDKHLYALDADTGILRWTFPTSSPIVAPPVVSDSSVYVSSANGALYALDARTGSQRWKFAAEKAILTRVSENGEMIFVVDDGGMVSALEKATGDVVWQTNLSGAVVGQPIVANGRIYVALTNEIFALDAANGAIVWRHYDPTRNLRGAPILFGTQLWQLTSEDVIGLNADTGTLNAALEIGDASANAGLSSDGRALYAGFFDGTLLRWKGTTE